MAKAVELPFFIHGEALYGRASETERELFIGGYCKYIVSDRENYTVYTGKCSFCISSPLSPPTLAPVAVEQNLVVEHSTSLSALQDQSHKLMFRHFLRTESGRGDTIDRWSFNSSYCHPHCTSLSRTFFLCDSTY